MISSVFLLCPPLIPFELVTLHFWLLPNKYFLRSLEKENKEKEGNFEPLGLPHCFMSSPLLFFHDILLVFGLQEDVKDWTIDLLTDALTRVEESVKRGYN